MFFKTAFLALVATTTVLAQNCGPAYANQVCAAGTCCSSAGWCANDAAHCTANTCQPTFSGTGSSCAKLINSTPQGQCGASNGYKVCATGECCSSSGWCDTDAAHCDAKTCQPKFSSSGSSCANGGKPVSSKTTTTPATKIATTTKAATTTKSTTKSSMMTSTTTFSGPYASRVPDIDVCGSGSGANNVSCPGAGINGYFYRCCSSHGHCGPKNNLQDESIYCGIQEAGCQPGYGNCDKTVAKPPNPTGVPGISQAGETCGPIVNKKCATGLCCSGSNFCGTGDEYCGAANWCQKSWGQCS